MADLDKLKKICSLTEMEIKNYCASELTEKGYDVVSKEGFLYAPGKYPVCLVAHLDTVHDIHDDKKVFKNSKDKEKVTERKKQTQVYKDGLLSSPQGIGGDDRCGIYLILELLKTYCCSVLFCEQEEVGGLGAKAFCESGITPDVNYFLEFDRKGTQDAVFYSCGTKEFIQFITEDKKWIKEWGSFSDISKLMPHFKIAGVNLSSGYEHAHFSTETINVNALDDIITRAKFILEKECEKPFEYVENHDTYGYSKYFSKYYNSIEEEEEKEDYLYRDDFNHSLSKKKNNWYIKSKKKLPNYTDIINEVENKYSMPFTFDYYDCVNQKTRIVTIFSTCTIKAIGKFLMLNPDVCFNDIIQITVTVIN